MSKPDLRAVLFDLGGVLCHFDPNARLLALAAEAGLAPREIHRLLWASGFDAASDRGEYTREGWLSYVHRALQIETSFENLRAIWSTAFTVHTQVLELARQVRGEVVTGLATNNGLIVADVLENELSEVGGSMDHLFLASQLGAAKPSPRFYEGVEHALNLTAANLLLIDDTEANVEGALTAGWNAIRFTDAAQLRAALAERGLPR